MRIEALASCAMRSDVAKRRRLFCCAAVRKRAARTVVCAVKGHKSGLDVAQDLFGGDRRV